MSSVSPLVVERFKRLGRASGEVWQAAMLRLPAWVDDPMRGRTRPQGGICVSLRSGRVHVKPSMMLRDPVDVIVDTLVEFGTRSALAGCRAARVEVSDAALAAQVAAAIGDPELDVHARDRLPELDAIIEDLVAATAPDSPVPDALSGRGVTVDRMRAFAEAAQAFYDAAPWRDLTNGDLIRVESPRVGRELSHVTVMSGGGQEFGLAFLESPDDFEDLVNGLEPAEFFKDRSHWSVSFGPIWDLPFGDVDLWEDRGLAVAGSEAYPIAFQASLDKRPTRPDAATLAYFEGLLRAMAETSEDELDTGRWTRTATTADGAMTFQLALCDLVDPPKESRPPRGVPDRRMMESLLRDMEKSLRSGAFETIEQANEMLHQQFAGHALDERPSTAETPLEKAQELMDQAFDARGRRQLQLAGQALPLSPDCADAYELLADRTSDPEAARDLYAKGVEAGERALGPRTFEEDAGHFWGAVGTRPYMRARLGLAQTPQALGRTDEAIGHYRELLRLNPNDNQGVRDLLLPLLLKSGRDAEAGELLRQYDDDPSPTWTYGYALWAFRTSGNSSAARERLRAAVRSNRHVVRALLAAQDTLDDDFDSFRVGGEEEAIACARDVGGAWRQTAGALAWLRANGVIKGKKGRPRR